MSHKQSLALVVLTVICAPASAHAASNREDVSTSPITAVDSVAITVSDADQAAEFYSRVLTFEKVADREVSGEDFEHLFGENYGPEQEHLNNVFGAHLRITSLRASDGPGVEFLEYLAPRNGRPSPPDTQANDLWSWQIVMRTALLPAVESALRQSHVTLVSTNTVHLGDNALNLQDGLIARDHDGHTTLISGVPTRPARIPLEE